MSFTDVIKTGLSTAVGFIPVVGPVASKVVDVGYDAIVGSAKGAYDTVSGYANGGTLKVDPETKRAEEFTNQVNSLVENPEWRKWYDQYGKIDQDNKFNSRGGSGGVTSVPPPPPRYISGSGGGLADTLNSSQANSIASSGWYKAVSDTAKTMSDALPFPAAKSTKQAAIGLVVVAALVFAAVKAFGNSNPYN